MNNIDPLGPLVKNFGHNVWTYVKGLLYFTCLLLFTCCFFRFKEFRLVTFTLSLGLLLKIFFQIFNLVHCFWTVIDSNFIFDTCIPCDILTISPWPWLNVSTKDTCRQDHNASQTHLVYYDLWPVFDTFKLDFNLLTISLIFHIIDIYMYNQNFHMISWLFTLWHWPSTFVHVSKTLTWTILLVISYNEIYTIW